VGGDSDAIKRALAAALSDAEQSRRASICNPFYVDGAADQMARILYGLFQEKKDDLLIKRYISGDPAKLGSLVRCQEVQ
jgi:hypothetical protein